MSVHIIPEGEDNLHDQTEDCHCSPELKIDEGTGEMVWIHECLTLDDLIDGLIEI